MLINKSFELNIDLNAKTDAGYTSFHFACMNGRTNIVEMMIENAENFKIDVNAKTAAGYTGFQIAGQYGKIDVVQLIKTYMIVA